jgi:hypothetical protein
MKKWNYPEIHFLVIYIFPGAPYPEATSVNRPKEIRIKRSTWIADIALSAHRPARPASSYRPRIDTNRAMNSFFAQENKKEKENMKKRVLIALLATTLLLPWISGSMSGRGAEVGTAVTERQADMPDTPAGRCAAEYLRAFNSGDENAMRAFILKYRSPSYLHKKPIENQMEFFRSLRQQWGNLSPQSCLSLSDYEVVVTARPSFRPDSITTLRFKVENADPYWLLGFTADQGKIDLRPINGALIESTLDSLAGILEHSYVLEQMGKEMAGMLKRHKSSGRYSGITNGDSLAEKITADLRALSKDLHLEIYCGPLPEGSPQGELGPETNYGFRDIKVMDGNIGYIRFDEFSHSQKAMEAAIKAMAAVADCEALIFDLRYNKGGGSEMGRLISSFLFDAPTRLDVVYDRLTGDITDDYTLENVPGKRFGQKKPVFILTSSKTASAAEAFGFFLQDLKRAVIIGERTMGTGHATTSMAVNDRFWMRLPFLRPISPVSKRNWEGTGIAPDIEVSADRALDIAQKEAVEKIGRNGSKR